jgi:hypothetical protein
MLYLASAFAAVAIALVICDLVWLTPGSGALVGLALIAAIACLCIHGVWSLIHHRRHGQRMSRA